MPELPSPVSLLPLEQPSFAVARVWGASICGQLGLMTGALAEIRENVSRYV
jgi:hypothetical protein